MLSALPILALSVGLKPVDPQKPVEFVTIPAKTYICREIDQLHMQHTKHFRGDIEFLTGIVMGCRYTKGIDVLRVVEKGEIIKAMDVDNHYWYVRKQDISGSNPV